MTSNLRLIPNSTPSALERADQHFAEARRDTQAYALALFAEQDRISAELRKLAELPEVLTSPTIRSCAQKLASHAGFEVERMRISLTNGGRVR